MFYALFDEITTLTLHNLDVRLKNDSDWVGASVVFIEKVLRFILTLNENVWIKVQFKL